MKNRNRIFFINLKFINNFVRFNAKNIQNDSVG
jgi:hypothetical protein